MQEVGRAVIPLRLVKRQLEGAVVVSILRVKTRVETAAQAVAALVTEHLQGEPEHLVRETMAVPALEQMRRRRAVAAKTQREEMDRVPLPVMAGTVRNGLMVPITVVAAAGVILTLLQAETAESVAVETVTKQESQTPQEPQTPEVVEAVRDQVALVVPVL
jgi:hypothetical protein